MEHVRPFTPLETFLKHLHEHPGDASAASIIINPNERAFAERLADGHIQNLDYISEYSYFSENDVAVRRHPRYMPAAEHSHEFFEVVFIFEGSGNHRLNGQRYPMKKGDLFIIPPGVVHTLEVFDDTSEVFNIMVRRSTFEQAFSGFLRSDDTITRFYWDCLYHSDSLRTMFVNTGEIYMPLVSAMCDESVYPDSDGIIKVYFELLMAYIARDCQDSIQYIGSGADDRLLVEIMRYLSEHYADASLEDAASGFGYSREHFSRLVKKCTGMGFSHLLRKVRMQKALMLLKKPHGLTVDEVIAQVGYTSRSHFYKAFADVYGTTPDRSRLLP